MKLNRLLGTLNISLTTTAAAVTIPAQYKGASVLLVGAQSSDSPIKWRRQTSLTASTSKLCPDSDITIPLNIIGEITPFYAKTLSETGTLEVEIWR